MLVLLEVRFRYRFTNQNAVRISKFFLLGIVSSPLCVKLGKW